MSIRSTIIRPLDPSFKNYLESDGVFVPEGSEDVIVESTLSDEDESESSAESEPEGQRFSFPELDAGIRSAIGKYQAVFPKLNFSSPKDAAWVLPMSSPLKCTSPADVYLLLKSSDFVTHDFSIDRVFEGCDADDQPSYDLELVLRKWYPVDKSREVRCFVRNDTLIGITQRDMNFYDYMVDPVTQIKIKATPDRKELTAELWLAEQIRVLDVFDLLLARDLSRGHILDFSPYAPRTNPLLFSYEELHVLFVRATHEPLQSSNGSKGSLDLPEFRVVDSPIHPAASCNAPTHQHNMVPIEVLSLSEGKSITEFSEIWRDEVQRATQGGDKEVAHEFSN